MVMPSVLEARVCRQSHPICSSESSRKWGWGSFETGLFMAKLWGPQVSTLTQGEVTWFVKSKPCFWHQLAGMLLIYRTFLWEGREMTWFWGSGVNRGSGSSFFGFRVDKCSFAEPVAYEKPAGL